MDPISPVKYDPWVYEFSKANTTPHVQWHDREKGDKAPVQDPRLYHAFPEDPVEVPEEEKEDKKKPKTDVGEKEEKAAEEEKKAAKAEEKKEAAPAKEEAKAEAPKAAFAQNEPEKVHVLDWEKYKLKADTNKPNTRTTFYDAKHGLYRQEPGQMMAQVMDPSAEDGAKKKAEDAAKEAKEAPKRQEALLERAAAAAANANDEKTSILEPMAYERRNNYALPFMRTTFYGQQE